MASFTVHVPSRGPTPDSRIEQARFVEDGLSLPAIAYTPVWLIVKRAWLGLGVWLFCFMAIGLLAYAGFLIPRSAVMILGLVEVLIGLEGPALIRLELSLRGWQMIDFVVAGDRNEAEERFFADHVPRLVSWSDDRVPPTYDIKRGQGQMRPMIGIFPAGET